MKKLVTSLLSASIIMVAATAAEAEVRWPNWYVGLHGSLAFVGEEDIDGNPAVSQLDTDTGSGYGVSLGYRPRVATGEWSSMRIEVEWHHQRSDVSTLSVPGGSAAGVGDVRVNAGLFNVFYDAATSMDEWRPYVGVGVGFADVQMKNSGALFAGNGDSDSVFAWNLMAGLGYIPHWMPYTEWVAGYRYFATSDAEFGLAGGGRYNMEYDSHNLEAGIRFLF